MKKSIYMFALALALVGLNSCDYDGKDDSYVTHYVTFSLNEGSRVTVPVGSSYSEPGFTAMENGEDVSSKVTVSGDEVDPDQIGIYNITYSAVNKDGFAASTSRQVVVYNPEVTTNITGTYTVATASCSNNKILASYPITGNTVTITQLAPGLYSVSDWWGGVYDQTIGYGSAYAAPGYFELKTDNSIVAISGENTPWGLTLTSGGGKYDPATGEVTLQSMLNYNITMTLTK